MHMDILFDKQFKVLQPAMTTLKNEMNRFASTLKHLLHGWLNLNAFCTKTGAKRLRKLKDRFKKSKKVIVGC
ncbi:hypothetical protein [Photorhabdus akhurstii]|uniref:hypothetical protein n=1 Tax=Photorhabdus akhurstii TaxID=171438 RepID=UPI003703760A